VNEQAATEVFVRDCLIYLGTCISPIGQGKWGERAADYTITFPGGRPPAQGTLAVGALLLFPLGVGEEATVILTPSRQFDVGSGRGVQVERRVRGGEVGLLLDGRGRPLQLPGKKDDRMRALKEWHKALDLYPN
jgi:hypothetical protein